MVAQQLSDQVVKFQTFLRSGSGISVVKVGLHEKKQNESKLERDLEKEDLIKILNND